MKAKCPFCNNTGIAPFVDMSKVPVGTSMVMGDETWMKYEEYGECPEGCKSRHDVSVSDCCKN